MPELSRAAIALGSNLSSVWGGPADNLSVAVERVSGLGRVAAVSSFLVTEAEIYVEQPQFVNAALLLETESGPLELIRELLGIEVAMGRVRSGVPAKGPRMIDLDLIFFDDLVLQTEELTLPHPGVAERRFVLAPLAEITPEWVHPGTGLTVREMLGRLNSPRI